MAQSEFTKLCADIRQRWPTVTHICVHHRLGWVEVGQASVAMAISSPHRHDGQQAIQHCIHQLKANIPIWKKEVYDTQDSSWKENAECSWALATNFMAPRRPQRTPERVRRKLQIINKTLALFRLTRLL
ncbi:molybdopterin synthase catalytic subunit-like [Siniperca chuatsi]|uniref:molybdopterin synthase catalytic subunit-like n=1 Tax=Siniperca chuatsi TaxID=119488 RepID=UPI001CE1CE44|nr:molybdopterin synthase catalytic subunit-like [Siniperca chuatsi]